MHYKTRTKRPILLLLEGNPVTRVRPLKTGVGSAFLRQPWELLSWTEPMREEFFRDDPVLSLAHPPCEKLVSPRLQLADHKKRFQSQILISFKLFSKTWKSNSKFLKIVFSKDFGKIYSIVFIMSEWLSFFCCRDLKIKSKHWPKPLVGLRMAELSTSILSEVGTATLRCTEKSVFGCLLYQKQLYKEAWFCDCYSLCTQHFTVSIPFSLSLFMLYLRCFMSPRGPCVTGLVPQNGCSWKGVRSLLEVAQRNKICPSRALEAEHWSVCV